MGRSESIWDFENGDRLAPDFLARLQRVFAADFLPLIAPTVRDGLPPIFCLRLAAT